MGDCYISGSVLLAECEILEPVKCKCGNNPDLIGEAYKCPVCDFTAHKSEWDKHQETYEVKVKLFDIMDNGKELYTITNKRDEETYNLFFIGGQYYRK